MLLLIRRVKIYLTADGLNKEGYMRVKELILGAAYYNEYMPYERIDEDLELMKKLGFNTIRIGESAWSTWEPKDGEFDFSKLTAVLEAACRHEISVIVGTPTYAIPSWLAQKYPDIMSVTKDGQLLYGHRQYFDITNEHYRYHCNRIIRKMMQAVSGYDCIIGYQIDNETRSADASSPDVQALFVEKLRAEYPDIDAFNREFGLDYWSNRIEDWDDFPDIRGTINPSLSAAYKRFLRFCITDFIAWQADIVREYSKEGQFITHNFDFDWRDHSYGLQPLVNQHSAGRALDVAGADIYHPSQSELTGAEIAICSDIARSVKHDNYLLLETQSQGRIGWLPYPGQLRMQGYAHLSGGSNSLMYWNWHSIHNGPESFWKGILSHDLEPSETYHELSRFTEELESISRHLINLRKNNKAAILLDHESLTAFDEYKEELALDYNDIVRRIYDACYEMNLECDVIYKSSKLDNYSLVILPALYSVDDTLIGKFRSYIENGGHMIATFKSFFADRELKIFSDSAPHGMTDVFDVSYDMFTVPGSATVMFDDGQEFNIDSHIELLKLTGDAIPWARYSHPYWNRYVSIAHSKYGQGSATYIGCLCDKAAMSKTIRRVARIAGIELPRYQFPLIRRCGVNDLDEQLEYIFNYSMDNNTIICEHDCKNLIGGEHYEMGEGITLHPWDVAILVDEG